MTIRRPLVRIDGKTKTLPVGDKLPPDIIARSFCLPFVSTLGDECLPLVEHLVGWAVPFYLIDGSYQPIPIRSY